MSIKLLTPNDTLHKTKTVQVKKTKLTANTTPTIKANLNSPVLKHRDFAKDLKVCSDLSPKMLGLILNDHAIKDTNFEGLFINETSCIDYITSILIANKNRFASLGLNSDRFIKKFAFLSTVNQNLKILFETRCTLGKDKENLLKELQKIGEKIAKSVEELAAGESLLLPGGWTGTEAAHAILYEVIKDNKNNYHFAIYNTGEGIENHPSIHHNLKQKFQGYIEIANISPEKMCNPSFYKTLFEIESLNRISDPTDVHIKGPDALYEGVVKYLGGKRKISNKSFLDYRTPQKSGTCTWKCLMEAIRQHCGDYEQYRRLKYLIQCQTLLDFSATLEKMDVLNLPIKERQSLEHLLQITSQKISRSLTKSFDSGFISTEELEKGLTLIKTLKIETTPVESLIVKGENSLKNIDLKDCKGCSFKTDKNPQDTTPQGVKASIENGIPDVPELDFTNIKKLERQIDRYYEVFKDKNHSYSTALRGIEILCKDLMALPMPEKGVKDLWDTIPEHDVNKTTQQLCRLVRLLRFLIESGNQGCNPQTLISTLHLVAIIDKLARKSKDTKLVDAPVYAGLLKSLNSIGFILPTKKLQDLRLAIEDYFEASDEAPEKRLFSFSAYHYDELMNRTVDAYGMLADFTEGRKNEKLHAGYYLDKEYIDKCLSDPAILIKLREKGVTQKIEQTQALLKDVTEYMPASDGSLKEAVLLTRLMQNKLRPTFGSFSIDSQPDSTSIATINPDQQLDNLLKSSIFFQEEIEPDKRAKYIKLISTPLGKALIKRRTDALTNEDIFTELSDDKPPTALWDDSNSTSKQFLAPSLARELSHVKMKKNSKDHKNTLLDNTELPNEVIVQENSEPLSFSAEEALHIRLTNVDERDSPWRFISFLEQHFTAFQDDGIQILLITYLYNSSITQILQEQPLFIEKLIKQSLRAYEIYAQKGDVKTAAFMMHYLKRIEGRYEEIFGNIESFNHIDYKNNLITLYPLVKNTYQKNAIDIALGLLHYQGALLNKSFTKEIAHDILRATFALQELKGDAHQHLLYQQELRYLQMTYRNEIAHYLDNEPTKNRDQILNTLIGAESSPRYWIGKYPDYITKDAIPYTLHYNVVRGELSKNGFINKEQKPISSFILEEYGLSKDSEMDADKFYYSSDKNKRLSIQPAIYTSLVCEYHINDKWLTYQQLEEMSEFIHSLGLSNVTGYYRDSDGYLFLANAKRDPLYKAAYTLQGDKIFINKIEKELDSVKYHLIDPETTKNDSAFKLLKFLNNENFILWKNATNDTEILEFKHGLLTFEKRDNLYYSLQYKEYCLATPREKTLSGFIDYIHLVHQASGREKILLLTPTESKPNRFAPPNFFPPFNFEDTFQVFNLDKDRMPIIKTSKDCVWLSYTALIMRNYQNAAHYLSRAEQMGKSDKTTLDLLKKLISLKDNHPDAINCKMQGLCLIKKNEILHSAKKSLQIKQMMAQELFNPKLYLEYCQTAGKGHLSALPLVTEKVLWRNLSRIFLEELSKKYYLLEKRSKLILDGEKPTAIEPTQSFSKVYQHESKPPFFSMSDFIPPSAYNLLNSKLRTPKEEQLIADRKLLPLIGAGKNFYTHFIDFYKDAKNKDPDLISRVEIMQADPDKKISYLASILEDVLVDGSKFPEAPHLEGDENSLIDTLQQWFSQVEKIRHSNFRRRLYKGAVSAYKNLPNAVPIMLASTSQLISIYELAFNIMGNAVNAWVDSKTTLWSSLRKKLPSLPSLSKPTAIFQSLTTQFQLSYQFRSLVKELSSRTSGLADTTPYHTKSSSQNESPLRITKKNLFIETIENIDEILIKKIEEKIKLSQMNMQLLEKNALELAEKLPQESSVATLIQMKRLAGDEHPLTMKELSGLFIIGQFGPYLKSTYLTQTDIEQLELLIGQYLQEKILNDHAKDCLELYNEYQTAKEDDKEYLKTKLLNLANQTPQYEPRDRREYLVFEAMTGIRLRSKQREKLDRLSEKDRTSLVIHMIMGDGKSTVITPIQALLLARQGLSPFIVVPDSLHQTGKETTKSTVYQSFGKLAHPFEIQRDSDFSKEKLLTLKESLEQWKEEKGFVYTTKESLLSFFLKSKELFYQYEETEGSEAKKELEETIELAWGINRHNKINGAALFDEAHSLLNCRDELNFTFGQAKHVNRKEAENIYDILRFLIQDPQMKSLIDLNNNNQAKMSSETYVHDIKPILVKRASDFFGVPQAYLNDAMNDIPSIVREHPNKNLIALSKVVISTFLPHTLTKKRDEHFGLGETKKYCIPYISNNNPNEKAEFSSYIETLLYTGYHYIQKGLTSEQLKEFRSYSLIKAQEQQIASNILLKETKANTLFKKITRQDLLVAFDIEKAKSYIKAHPDVMLDYCLEKVVGEILIFPYKLSGNSHHLTSLFKQVDAMTGTPWNKDSYPSQFKTLEEVEINNKSSYIIQKIIPTDLISIDATKDTEIFSNIINAFKTQPNARALIDAGALIKGLSNEEVAKALLNASNSADIDGVAYYDEDNELKILEKTSMKSVIFKDSSIPKERRITFYDQSHTLGSDIPQQRDAKALVTLSETLKKYELFQAIWRMREIDKDQKLSFLIPKNIKSLITKDSTITSQKILDFVTQNQIEQELFDNFRSRKLEIKSIVEEAIYNALIEAPNFKARYTIFKKTQNLLMISLDTNPFEAFGEIDKEDEADKILQKHEQKWIGILENLEKEKAIVDASKYKGKIKTLRKIPLSPKYRTTNNTTLDTQVENQIKMQEEVKLTVATKPDVYKERMHPWTPWQWPEKLDIFKDNWMTTGPYFSSTAMPLYLAQDLLIKAKNKTVASMKGTFNNTFLVSNNFLPQQIKTSLETPAAPFMWYAKPVYHLVVIEEVDGAIKTLMIDQNDLPFFRDKLIQDQGNYKRKICIYDPAIGITLQGKLTFNEHTLKTNDKFIKHLIYAKFWNGISKYTDHEIPFLESWIRSQGIHSMFEFFKEIVRNKENSRKNFENSTLRAVFEKLYQESRLES